MRPSAIFQFIVICAFGLTPCFAQQNGPVGTTAPLSAAQLDSLTAPIALYPDALVAQILTAATYPLEVVEAAHWLEDRSHAALTGDALAASLEHEDWDFSVKSLVPFPDTLRMMERNLKWTEQIGDAFLAQQADVMDSIQRLRQLAIAAGTLKSTPQQTVWNQDDEIVVEPVSPDLVYVPYYNPTIVYGSWPWPEYAPFSFAPPAGIYLSGPTITFGIGFPIIRPLWGWSYWSWPRHSLYIPPHLPHTWPLRPGPWRHDPDHRRGLPYRDRDRGPGHTARPFPPGAPLGPHGPLPGRPRVEAPPRPAPPADRPRSGTEPPPIRRPRPIPGSGHSSGDNRFRQRPPTDRPRPPAGPSAQRVPPSGRGHESRPPGRPPGDRGVGPRAQPPGAT